MDMSAPCFFLSRIAMRIFAAALGLSLLAGRASSLPADEVSQRSEDKPVDASSIRGKVLCGYQGWFRCPGDPSKLGWIHWSRDSSRITPRTVSFEMWPDLTEYTKAERFPAPGFTYPDGAQAELFSSDNAQTVLRHFRWLRSYGIDGVWLQHFLVDLPGASSENRYASRLQVLQHVRAAARQTGRVWALAFDISGMPAEQIYGVLTRNWQSLVDAGIPQDPRYLHEGRRPVVEIWGFYARNESNPISTALAARLIDFFKAPGPYSAFLIGGGDWDWRRNPDSQWRDVLWRLDGYSPWNVGNYRSDTHGVRHAATDYWSDDLRECERHGVLWLPVLYPGFSWNNLKRHAANLTTIPRRKGAFFWEQFHELAQLKVDRACIAMFDEVDEGTAIFKVTSSPPVQGAFVGYEGLPSDWYLRLVGEGAKMLHGRRPLTAQIPITR
jgi:hypothetical protein